MKVRLDPHVVKVRRHKDERIARGDGALQQGWKGLCGSDISYAQRSGLKGGNTLVVKYSNRFSSSWSLLLASKRCQVCLRPLLIRFNCPFSSLAGRVLTRPARFSDELCKLRISGVSKWESTIVCRNSCDLSHPLMSCSP